MISEFYSHAFMLTSFSDFKWKEDENKFERGYKEWILAQFSLALKILREHSKAIFLVFNIQKQDKTNHLRKFFCRTAMNAYEKKG